MSKARLAAGASAAVLALAMPLVAHWEGVRQQPYLDPVGIPTVCYGETHVEMRAYSQAECRDMLLASLAKHGAQIEPCLPQTLPANVKASSLSFAYNVGAGAFCGSTMARKLQAGDIPGACAELSRWVCVRDRDKGRALTDFDRAMCPTSTVDRQQGFVRFSLPGLVSRRAAERAMCEGRAP